MFSILDLGIIGLEMVFFLRVWNTSLFLLWVGNDGPRIPLIFLWLVKFIYTCNVLALASGVGKHVSHPHGFEFPLALNNPI